MGYGYMTNYSSRSESFWVREQQDYLIDAGKGGQPIKEVIRRLGAFYTLDCFVISHGDDDHIGLASMIVRYLKPSLIVISPLVYAYERFRYESQQ